MPENLPEPNVPGQATREHFASAITNGDVTSVEMLLGHTPSLANTDLRPEEERDRFTNGLPLFRACQSNHTQIAEILLEHGADPNATGNNPEAQPEFGMPLHFAAAEHRNFRLANLLLDRGVSPNGHPNCDQSTIERMYYQARENGLPDEAVRRAYSSFLPDPNFDSKSLSELVGNDSSAAVQLFERMVSLGGQPPISAIVRDGQDDLLLEIAAHCPDKNGTPHDHPNSSVFNDIFGAARWYGYPQLLRRLMMAAPERFNEQSAIETIGVAIISHNRDGGYAEYREMIVMMLELLDSLGKTDEARCNPDFQPLFQIATDFTWHENYGYRAKIASPECYVDLAELFVSWKMDNINYVSPKTGHSPLSAAVNRGHHPGIATYIEWLLDHGADLRDADAKEVNPLAIATQKGFDEIRQILLRHKRG